MGQQPAPGSHVREGRAVSFIVSDGVHIFPMPDLRFESLRDVTLELCARQARSSPERRSSPTTTCRPTTSPQDPPPLTSVREGTAVTLTLSKGPPANVARPELRRHEHRCRRATAAAKPRRSHLGQIVWTPFGPNGPPRGMVVRQSPAAGQLDRSVAPGLAASERRARRIRLPRAPGPRRRSAIPVTRRTSRTCGCRCATRPDLERLRRLRARRAEARLQRDRDRDRRARHLRQQRAARLGASSAWSRRCRCLPRRPPREAGGVNDAGRRQDRCRRCSRRTSPTSPSQIAMVEAGRRRLAASRLDGRPLRSEPHLGAEDRRATCASSPRCRSTAT